MKLIKKLLKPLILSILFLTISGSAFAVTYTPDNRDVETYYQGVPGFSYPSFNNFRENPNTPEEMNEFEPEFLLGVYCPGGNCPGGHQISGLDNYFDTITNEVKPGDKIRFAIYFHNNGSDPYDDNDKYNSEDAENVSIGIDFKDIISGWDDKMLLPEGYIYSTNQEYRTNKDDPSSVIKKNGAILRRATDDMWVKLHEAGLKLVPVEDSIFLNNNVYNGYVTEKTEMKFNTQDGIKKVEMTPYVTDDKMWLYLNKLPGCFRYSGLVWMDVEVTKKETPVGEINFCKNLYPHLSPSGPIYVGDTVSFTPVAKYSDNLWYKVAVYYSTTQNNGVFSAMPFPTVWLSSLNRPTYEEVFFKAQKAGQNAVKLEIPGFNNYCIEYFDVLEPTCESIKVTTALGASVPSPLYVPTIQSFKATSTAGTGGQFNGDIEYSISQFPTSKGCFAPTLWGALTQNSSCTQSITVPQGTTVWLNAQKGGLGAVKVDTLNTVNSACTKRFNLTEPACEILDVTNALGTPLSPIIEGEIKGIRAEPQNYNPPGGEFNGDVTYTINANNGCIADTFYGALTGAAPLCNQSITIPQGAIDKVVWVNAQKGGQNVIRIDTKNTLNPACTRWLDIEKIDKCASLTVTPSDPLKVTDPSVPVSLTGVDTAGNPLPLLTKVIWTSTGGSDVQQFTSGGTSILNQSVVMGLDRLLVPASPSGVVEVGLDPADPRYSDQCKQEIAITPVCESLGLDSDPDPIVLDPQAPVSAVLNLLNPIDSDGNPLPVSTLLNWNAGTTSAEFAYQGGSAITNPTEIEDPAQPGTFPTPIDATNILNAGTISVAIDSSDPLYSEGVCQESIEIGEQQIICEEIEVDIQETETEVDVTSLSPSTWYTVSSEVTYNPPYTNTVTYSSEYGVFVDPTYVPGSYSFSTHPDGESLEEEPGVTFPQGGNPAVVEIAEGETIYFVTYADIAGNVSNALEIQATDRSEAACTKTFSIVVAAEPCKSVDVDYSPSPFDGKEMTFITVNPGDFGDFEGGFVFTTSNPNEAGLFYGYGQMPYQATYPGMFTQEESEVVVYLPGDDAKSDTEIYIKAFPYDDPLNGNGACDYKITGTPEEIKCIDLDIVTPSGDWDEIDDDDEQKFKIDVTTSPSNEEGEFDYMYTVDDNKAGNWKHGKEIEDGEVEYSGLTNYLEDIDEDDLDYVEIWAVDEDGDKLYDDGKWVCHDKIKYDPDEEEEEPDDPRIKKAVYDYDKEDWRSVINIGGKDENNKNKWLNEDDQYVTYLATFYPEDAESFEIWEDNVTNGYIRSTSAAPGKFDYTGMLIAVNPSSGDNYIMYQSSGFDAKTYSTGTIRVDGDKLSSFDNYDDDEDDYEDDYKCNDGDELCIKQDFSGNNLDEIFRDGEKLKFKVKKPGKIDKVYIVYQFENNTAIDDDFCETMEATKEGCGERFDNKIKFEAYEDDDWDDNPYDWEGHDDAKVIVICPFILARGSGDTFFYDEIDTGIDVDECTEVQNIPFIIKPKDPKQPITEVGIPVGEEDLTIITPTHNVCKLSNYEIDELPLEYRNVFKNFSSSVCEVEAEVAEEWKKENIVDAINANITKISRWISGDMKDKLYTVNDLDSGNGIFVKEGGTLEIIGSGGSYEIYGTDNLPAAQTYIVRNGILKIKSNVVYNDSSVDPTSPRTMPSAAFIVIDGNIEISNNVTKIDGVLMAVDTNDSGDGQIKSLEGTKDYTHTLTINGSLIGNIYDLFINRRAAGDPLKDEGSITVRYDERILLNTPPGLNELIDVTQLRVAN